MNEDVPSTSAARDGRTAPPGATPVPPPPADRTRYRPLRPLDELIEDFLLVERTL
ncbi:hypothetical protein PHK61_13985 [Actinomycetospora lutea]|uniref:hypothetical protein n=1 Tax=Actinomycetospora lutea TaxID=663604 RepID=UPI002365A120|nr:hypothetical protein [Actinomycetospora lutea]MDD7939529.1 hypothetical protein [Actinomycetospora lutea]